MGRNGCPISHIAPLSGLAMRLIAFLFLAIFGLAGVIRYSKAAAPAPVAALAPLEAARPLAALQAPVPTLTPAAPQPAPQVLRHKRRFAKAALRAIRKAEVQDKPAPPRQVAKLAKPAPRR